MRDQEDNTKANDKDEEEEDKKSKDIETTQINDGVAYEPQKVIFILKYC